jgi:hypothetical protein
LGLDPRPLVKILLQPLGPDRPIGQAMRGQDREGPPARAAKVALNPLLERPLRIGIPLVTSMAVDRPRTTAGSRRTQSFELIFAKLNAGASPKSSGAIKSLYPGLHEPNSPPALTNVAHLRSVRISQRYRNVVSGGPGWQCCGPAAYDPEVSGCCGPAGEGQHPEIYDKEERTCCQGNVIDPEEYICCYDNWGPKTTFACCDCKIYNYHSHMCIDGEIVPKP